MTIRAGDQSEDVSEVQRILAEGGYYSGPIDGVYGPDTEAAVVAYQTAHGLSPDGVVGPETWGNMHGDPAYPNNSTGALGGGGGGNAGGTAPGTSAADYDEIKKAYPQFAHLIDDPEIGPILREANSRPPHNRMPGNEFEAKIMATNWWKNNAASARNYYTQQHTDPATFNNKIRDYRDQIRQIGGIELGYDETVLTEGYLDHFAHRAYREGLTPAQIKAMLANEITPLIGTTEKSPILAQLRDIQQQYDYLIDDSSLHYWLGAIGSGRQTIENFRLSIVQQMKGLYPHLANSFDEGMTLDQITRPYRTTIADMLELDPNKVDFGDPKWRHVVDYVDPKDGTHRSMSNQELSKYIKSQGEYWSTRRGQDESGEFVEGILTDFGAVRR